MGALLTVFLAPFLGMESPLGPVQILWVAMISDGPPAIALGSDPPRDGLMDEPPRDPSAQVLTWRRLAHLLFAGAVMAAGTLGLQLWARAGATPAQAPTLAFTTFVLFQVFNALNVRSEDRTIFRRQLLSNVRLWLALAAVVGLQVAVVYWAPLQHLFGVSRLGLREWGICLGVAAMVVVAEEGRKLVAGVVGRGVRGRRVHLRRRPA
jgi:Ca2+-transporting ATPase